MPCLSIIVPHLRDDSGLEASLLSILENRDNDFEVLIAHDGGYTDPYGLSQDEAVLIESPHGSCLSAQINAAAASARSPYIQVIVPGATVAAHWFDEARALLEDPGVCAVGLPIADNQSDSIYYGLIPDSLPHRRIANDGHSDTMPLVLGSVFRKKVFNAIGGLLEQSSREIAEVELGLLLSVLGLDVVHSASVKIHANKRAAIGVEPGYEIGRACGQLACAYAAIEQSHITIDSLARRLGHLASGLMSPKTVAERLGWVMGIRERTFVEAIRQRVENAIQSLDSRSQSFPMPNYETPSQQRRAA